jgi:hypothetical protein
MSHERHRSRVTLLTFARIRFSRAPAGGVSDTTANVRAVGLAMIVAAVLLALFNSSELRGFTRDLPGNSVSDALVVGADRWHELMLQLGPARVRPAVRDLFLAIRGIAW